MESFNRRVNYYECDRMGITHHSNYIRFMEEARLDFMDRLGCGFETMEAQGIASPVLSIDISYKKPTTFKDIISIEVRILELKTLKIRIGYTMTVGNDTVCTAESTHCFLENGRPVSLEQRFPEFFQKLKEGIA